MLMKTGLFHRAGSVCWRAYSNVNGRPISSVDHEPRASAPLANTPRYFRVHKLRDLTFEARRSARGEGHRFLRKRAPFPNRDRGASI